MEIPYRIWDEKEKKFEYKVFRFSDGVENGGEYHDKTGKIIFVGDIVVTDNYDTSWRIWGIGERGYTIINRITSCTITGSNWCPITDGTRDIRCLHFCRVVGNTHENPDPEKLMKLLLSIEKLKGCNCKVSRIA